MIDFTNVKAITIPEGAVKKITRKSNGDVLWKGQNGLLKEATEVDGITLYNGGLGYKPGYRIRSTGAEVAQSGCCCTGFMPVGGNDIIYVKGIEMNASETYNAIAFYDFNKTKILQSAFGASGYGWCKFENGIWKFLVYQTTIDVYNNAKFFRFSCGKITDETIVTVNEEIEL